MSSLENLKFEVNEKCMQSKPMLLWLNDLYATLQR
jgi:hypothetical protein